MMPIEKLQYITNGVTELEILDEVTTVVDAGCSWIQLRIKDQGLAFENIALQVKEICKNKAVFIVNDRVEIAKRVNADGVHLGLEDQTIPEARIILGKDKIMGGTANTLADCLMHQNNGANYIGLGPYRYTTTKKNLSPFLGLQGFQNILPKLNCLINVPVVAIGGIEKEDIPLLMNETSIYGIAVSGLISKSHNRDELIRQLHYVLNKARF